MSVHAATHPLIRHKMTVLRNEKTSSADFRAILREITFYLGYEATRDIQTVPEEITTPIGATFQGAKIGQSVSIIPILRAGLGMSDAMLELIPKAIVHHIGMYRSPSSLLPVQYYNRLPKNGASDVAYILDPCIATSGTLHAVCSMIKKWGAKKIVVISVIASSVGLARLQEQHPDIDIYVGAVDADLSEDGLIVPGLGDAGDRQFGAAIHHAPHDGAVAGGAAAEDDASPPTKRKLGDA